MGLFDQFTNLNPDQTQGLLSAAAALLQAGGPSRTPVSFGQAIGGGLQAFQQGMQNAAKQRQDAEQAAQAALLRSQALQSGQLDIEGRQREQQQQALLQQAYGESGGDPQKLVDAVSRVDPIKGFQLRQQLAKATEFDTKPQVGVDADGKPFTYIIGKDGTVKRLENTLPRDELKLGNFGGYEMAYNPYALQPGQKFARTMSPEGAAANALGWANYNKPQFNSDAGGFVGLPTKANPSGTFTPLAGLPNKTPKMTEDQAKATGWLVQAENAYTNLKKVAFDKEGKITSAARPGVADAIAEVPGLGSIGNYFRTADRQKFNQASSSLAEALLRAATGAGVNIDEARQKVQEITPVFGEDAETTQQKFDSIPLYLDTLRVRSGPGAESAAGISAKPRGGTGKWGITKVSD